MARASRVSVETVVIFAGKVAVRRIPSTGGLLEGRGKDIDGGIAACLGGWTLTGGSNCGANTECVMGL